MAPPGYRLVARIAHRLPLPPHNLAQSVTGRRGACDRWLAWASIHRTTEPLFWVHAASVGEGLTAQPVIERLRAAVPSVQIAFTYSSVSTARWPDAFGADRADYVPLDEARAISDTFDALRPGLLIFSRGDLWPELVAQAAAQRIPQAVIGGTVREGSRRLRWPTRPLLQSMHRTVSWVGAVSERDADGWGRLGVPAHAIEVTGDPRHDQVLERLTDVSRIETLFPWAARGTVLVAGSTDARDEEAVLEAFTYISRSDSSARLLFVPHELSERHLDALLAQVARRGIQAERWDGAAAPGDVACIVVTAMGKLADLYVLANVAYVGGGFRGRGIHAVAEPAAYAVPIVVGPEFGDSRDACACVETGGAVVLPSRSPSAALCETWQRWHNDPAARLDSGLRARRALGEGAASATVEALLRLLE